MPLISFRNFLILLCLPIVILKGIQWYITSICNSIRNYQVPKITSQLLIALIYLSIILVVSLKDLIQSIEVTIIHIPHPDDDDSDAEYNQKWNENELTSGEIDPPSYTSTEEPTSIETTNQIDIVKLDSLLEKKIKPKKNFVRQPVFINESWQFIEISESKANQIERKAERAHQRRLARSQIKQQETKMSITEPFAKDYMLHKDSFTCLYDPHDEEECENKIDLLIWRNKEMMIKHRAYIRQIHLESQEFRKESPKTPIPDKISKSKKRKSFSWKNITFRGKRVSEKPDSKLTTIDE
ncbi:uncharacterized protein I206_105091 [Kwoniella pini CBS 10737]|uniref:Uncharacterized protein n=1 Tax=Kwoniella pini CBS 10737 TaxID=1296096 RepID=A0A1B9I8T4_9TREE|nr:uncharacterized protein I206_02631 [Kwoniella pini CBS 10737]OCF51915.1 hypothetical protein I206_02631 [Kwoniella pini CBS 10737]